MKLDDADTVPCETCGTQTHMLGTKRCNGCWEVEARLAGYLRGGEKARAFVAAELMEPCEPKLRTGDSAGAIESFRTALREALKSDPTGDFGVEVAVAAFDEILNLVRQDEREACAKACEALQEREQFGWLLLGRSVRRRDPREGRPVSDADDRFFLRLAMAPRESLLTALAAAVGDKHAESILSALETYLADDEDGGRARPQFFPHRDPDAELEKVRAERDAALERAKEAEAALRRVKTGQKQRRGS